MFLADATNSVDRCGRQTFSALVIVIPKYITLIDDMGATSGGFFFFLFFGLLSNGFLLCDHGLDL